MVRYGGICLQSSHSRGWCRRIASSRPVRLYRKTLSQKIKLLKQQNLHFMSQSFLFVCMIWDRVWLCSLIWPGTCGSSCLCPWSAPSMAVSPNLRHTSYLLRLCYLCHWTHTEKQRLKTAESPCIYIGALNKLRKILVSHGYGLVLGLPLGQVGQ